jgi:hypothetical protein
MNVPQCTDPVIGDILSGWRYDISGLSPAMRTDYDQHLSDCAHCRRRQHLARSIDVLLISVTSLSIVAFLLAALVIHRVETMAHFSNLVHAHLHHTAITISLEAVAIAGLAVSTILWVLVAIATPLPGLVSDLIQQRVPAEIRNQIRDRIMKNAA